VTLNRFHFLKRL